MSGFSSVTTLRILAPAALVLAGSLSQGAPIATHKDWTLEDLGPVCVASTQRVVGTETFRYEIALQKSGLYPVETLMRVAPERTAMTAQFVYDAKKQVSYHYVRQVDPSNQVSYWQVPRGTEALISYIKRGNSLNVEVVSPGMEPVKVDFSLRGSSATVDALQAKCGGGRAMTSNDFEKNFLDLAKLGAFDPAALRPDQVERMRTAYFTGYAADATRKQKEKELAVLTAKYTKQIQALAKIEGTLDQLEQKELAALMAKKEAIELKIRELDGKLSAKQQEIAVKDTELQRVNAAYDAAWQILAPHEPEYKRLSGSLNSAQSSLHSAQNRLARIDSSISSIQRQIADLEAEAQSRRSRLNSAERNLDSARREYNEAARDLNGFDENREVEERLRRSPGYDSDKRELNRLEREQRRASQDADRAQRDLNQARRQVDQCERGPEPRDCARFRQEAQEANRRYNQARREEQQIANDIRLKQWSVEQAESRARAEVGQEKSRLADRERRASSLVNDLETAVTAEERRIRDITQFDIPGLQNDLGALRGERPGVVASIGQLKAEVAALRTQLESYKSSVGYDAKKAAVDAAAAEVVRVKRDVAKLESEKSAIVTETGAQKKSLAAVGVSIDKTLKAIADNQGKSAELKNLLTPYFEAKAQLDADIAVEIQKFAAAKAAFNADI